MGVKDSFSNPFGRNGYFTNLSSEFGVKFVILCCLIYGVNQGVARTIGYGTGIKFWFIEDLQLAPADGANRKALAAYPWDVKAAMGILTDAFAIRGLHRTPYLLFGTVCGAASWAILGLAPTPGKALMILLILLTNLAVALPDVIIDACVAERCQRFPKYAVDLQSLLWGALSFTSIFASLAAGELYSGLGAKGTFLFTACLPAAVAIPTLLGFLGEEKDDHPEIARKRFVRGLVAGLPCVKKPSFDSFEEFTADEEKGPAIQDEAQVEYAKDAQAGTVYVLAVILCIVALSIGTIMNIFEDTVALSIFWVFMMSVICGSLYFFLSKISTDLARASIFIFIKGALVPYGYINGYWNLDTWEDKKTPEADTNCCSLFAGRYKEELNVQNFTGYGEHCFDEAIMSEYGRPCFTKTLIKSIDVVGNCFGLFGVWLYRNYLSEMSYRKIWGITQVCLFVFGFLELIWVSRTNRAIGLPDEFMLVADGEVLAEILGKFESMPLFILAAKLCPPGIEGTLFAMMMGLSNFGYTMSDYLGANVLTAMGGIELPLFEGYQTFIIIANSCKLLILCVIPFLVPTGSPSDPSIYENQQNVEKEQVEIEKAKRYSLGSLQNAKI